MKLATLRANRPDGQLVVVSHDLSRCVSAGRIAPSLQAVLDDWDRLSPALAALSTQLDKGEISGQPFEPSAVLAPLPRAFQWIDGAGYLATGSGAYFTELDKLSDADWEKMRAMIKAQNDKDRAARTT